MTTRENNLLLQFMEMVYPKDLLRYFELTGFREKTVLGGGCSGASQFAYGFLSRLCLGNSGLDQVQVRAHTYLRYV